MAYKNVSYRACINTGLIINLLRLMYTIASPHAIKRCRSVHFLVTFSLLLSIFIAVVANAIIDRIAIINYEGYWSMIKLKDS